jgi:hypothetical protein
MLWNHEEAPVPTWLSERQIIDVAKWEKACLAFQLEEEEEEEEEEDLYTQKSTKMTR